MMWKRSIVQETGDGRRRARVAALALALASLAVSAFVPLSAAGPVPALPTPDKKCLNYTLT